MTIFRLPTRRRTKKKHIYVISTLQRPVPLEHYLYTGPAPKVNPHTLHCKSHEVPIPCQPVCASVRARPRENVPLLRFVII